MLRGCIGVWPCQYFFRLSHEHSLSSYLLESTGYFGISPVLSPGNLPENDTTKSLADGLAEAHRAYGVSECVLPEFGQGLLIQPQFNSAHILFVVEPHERNIFDQRLLEYQLSDSCVTISTPCFCHLTEIVATASAPLAEHLLNLPQLHPSLHLALFS